MPVPVPLPVPALSRTFLRFGKGQAQAEALAQARKMDLAKSDYMKKILITGVAGFIGFHTALALASRGNFVIGIDNFNAYYPVSLKRERAAILKQKGIESVEGDLNDRALVASLCERHAITHILHLAAQAGVRYARTHPEAYIESNINGFLSILETLKKYPHIKLVYASSSSVYGCNEKIPFSTEDQTDKPANLYAATKKANELMAYSYHHLYGFSAIGLRFFTVYGPWGRPDMAYYSFTQDILAGRPLHLFNEGKMKRDFTYIDDIVEGTVAALDHPAPFEIFNLGNHCPVPLLDFVSTLENIIGKKAQIVFEKESKGEVGITCADISKAQKELAFQPKTTLAEGLGRFVHWFLSGNRLSS